MFVRQPSTIARRRILIAAAATTLLVAGSAIALLHSGSGHVTAPEPATHAGPKPPGPDDEPGSRSILETAEPHSFAIAVANTVFAWDTKDPTPLNEYAGRLLAVADPSGQEAAGLVTDMSTYLPNPESWEDLKTYETRQWIDIQSYEVPDDWKSAESSDKTADLVKGTTAYTVTGLRRRSGIWRGEPAQTVDQVSFTIFMTCRPTYATCKLLRLSQLNNPLR